MDDRLARGLFETLGILREYLPEIVVGGGWAPFLYHRYLFRDCEREPIFTRDIDLMVRPKVPVIDHTSDHTESPYISDIDWSLRPAKPY